MKSAVAVSCHGPRLTCTEHRRAPRKRRLARRWIATALLLAVGLTVLAFAMADPAGAYLAAMVMLPDA